MMLRAPLLVLILVRGAYASPARVPLSQSPTVVLGGQLTLALPSDASANQQIGVSHRDETRFVYSESGSEMVIVATQTYAVSKTGLSKAIVPYLRSRGAKAKGRPKAISLEGFEEAWEVNIEPDRSALMPLVYAVFVRSDDSTVQALYFYLEQEALRSIGLWMPLARRIAASTKAGNRRMELAEAEVAFEFGAQLSLKKPAHWVFGLAQSDDSSVRYRARKLGPLGRDSAYCDIEFRERSTNEPTRPSIADGPSWTAEAGRANAEMNINMARYIAIDCVGSSDVDLDAGKSMISTVRFTQTSR